MDARHFPISDLVTVRVVDVTATSTLRSAAQLLDDEVIGALLVRETRGTLGILSERDVVRAIADGADVDQARVADYMTEDLVIMPGSASLVHVLEMMRDNEIRHVAVRADDVVGIVSMRAVVEALLPQPALT